MAFNQKNPPWQRNAGHQGISNMQAIVSFPQAQPVYNPNIGLQQQQNISILPQIGMQQQQALYSQTVQYPTNRPINAIGFQNQPQSQPTQSPVGQNSSKFNPSNRVFSGTGIVTKLQNEYGFIDEEVFFHKNTCVKGIVPKVGDRVLIDAAYNTNMPFKWNASRVQVLPGTNTNTSSSAGHANSTHVRSHAPMYSSAQTSQSESRSSNARNRYNTPPRKSPDRHMPRSSNSRSKDDYEDSDRRRKRDDREGDRQIYRDKHQERSSERGRERERSPVRKPSPKRRRVRSVPRYMVQVPKHLLTIKQADMLELRRRYTNLYIPSDFFVSDIRWTEAFPPDAPFSISSPCHFHVMHKDVELPLAVTAAGGDTNLDPLDADYLYSAKVMLMSTPPMAEFYEKCISKSANDNDRYEEERDHTHPTRMISFLVGMRGKNETMAIGGPWSPSLDGTDPQSDPTVLIRTAIRTCRALTGIDLSSCSQWYRFVELYYRRSESYHKGRLIPPRVETVVIFLPDVRSCQPTRLEWEQLRLSYKASLARVINSSSSSSSGGPGSNVEVATTIDAVNTSLALAKLAIPSSKGADDVTKSSTINTATTTTTTTSAVAPSSIAADSLGENATATPNAVPADFVDSSATVVSQSAAAAPADVGAESQQETVADTTVAVSSSATLAARLEEKDDNAASTSPAATAAAPAPLAAAVSIMDSVDALPVMGTTVDLLQDFKKMRVADLKVELNKRNLSTDGVKAVLLSRLSEAVMKEHTELQRKQQELAEQLEQVEQLQKLKQEEPTPVELEVKEKPQPIEQMEVDTDAVKVEALPVTIQDEIMEEKAVLEATTTAQVSVKTVDTKVEVATSSENNKPSVVPRKKEEPIKLSEKERQLLERRYQLPEKPHIIVHPSRSAKSGKFDCSVISLSVLLDYRPEDTKEHSFEVALFSELFNEMLTRDFGFNIYRALCALPYVKKQSEESKKDITTDGGNGTKTLEGTITTSNGEDGGGKAANSLIGSDKGDDSKKKSTHGDDKEQHERKRARHSETTDDERKSRDKEPSGGKKLVVNSDLLLSFVYFDVTHCGYIAEKDVEDLLYTLGLNLSRSQVRKTVSKAITRDTLHYRKLTDKMVPVPTKQGDATLLAVEDAEGAEKLPAHPSASKESGTVDALEVLEKPEEETEVPQPIALGNTDYKVQLKSSLEQLLKENIGDGRHQQQQASPRNAELNALSQVATTRAGIVEYNGCVVDIGKLLEQVKRTESAREEVEKQLVSLQDQHSKLVTSNNRATSKIKDLQSETKTLNRQLSDLSRQSREAVQTQADYFNVIQSVYERVRPCVLKTHRDGSSSAGSSKRESSKETSSRATSAKSKEKEIHSKDTTARGREAEKSAKEKSNDLVKVGTEDGSSMGGGDDVSQVVVTDAEQLQPKQTTPPSAMETENLDVSKNLNEDQQNAS